MAFPCISCFSRSAWIGICESFRSKVISYLFCSPSIAIEDMKLSALSKVVAERRSLTRKVFFGFLAKTLAVWFLFFHSWCRFITDPSLVFQLWFWKWPLCTSALGKTLWDFFKSFIFSEYLTGGLQSTYVLIYFVGFLFVFLFLGTAWKVPDSSSISQPSEREKDTTAIHHMLQETIQIEDAESSGTSKREEPTLRMAKRQNGGKGPPGSTLSQRLEIESIVFSH